MTLPWNTQRCGDRITITTGSNRRMMLMCVRDQHPETDAHRSGTDPQFRWVRDGQGSIRISIRYTEGLFG